MMKKRGYLIASALVLAGCSSPASQVALPDLAEQLRVAGGGTQVIQVTESNDPNNLIGRPNGYTGAAIIQAAGQECETLGVDCGATLEKWPSADTATSRAEYLQTIQKAAPILGSEWDYVKGDTILRVSGKLTPSEAKKYSDAFGGTAVTAS